MAQSPFRRRRLVLSGVLTVLVVVGGLWAARYLLQQDEPPKKPVPKAKPRLVISHTAQPTSRVARLPISGRLRAWNAVELYAEVTGRLLPGGIPFRDGIAVNAGDTLLKLDDQEARLNAHAQRAALASQLVRLLPDVKLDFPDRLAAWQDYVDQLDPTRRLPDLPPTQTDRERRFWAANGLYERFYTIRSLEERLSKYAVLAPFAGQLTGTTVQPGGLVRANQPVGRLVSANTYELVASVPEEQVQLLFPGAAVHLHTPTGQGQTQARLERIGTEVDPQTQQVKLYIRLQGANWYQGQFVEGVALGQPLAEAVPLPRTLLRPGPAVFLIQGDTLAEHPVDVLHQNADTALVRGLPPGAELLFEVIPSAYPGMPVRTRRSGPTVPPLS